MIPRSFAHHLASRGASLVRANIYRRSGTGEAGSVAMRRPGSGLRPSPHGAIIIANQQPHARLSLISSGTPVKPACMQRDEKCRQSSAPRLRLARRSPEHCACPRSLTSKPISAAKATTDPYAGVFVAGPGRHPERLPQQSVRPLRALYGAVWWPGSLSVLDTARPTQPAHHHHPPSRQTRTHIWLTILV